MNDQFQESVGLIHELFNTQFMQAYRKIKTHGKSKILRYTSHFHRQWYYSAIIENTILSPANLVASLQEEQETPNLTAPVVQVKRSGNSFTVNHNMLSYSLEEHPVVKDLEIFVDTFKPSITLSENDYFPPEIEGKLLNSLSIYDPSYIEYLLILSIHLRLIKKMPAIHASKAQVTKKADKFFEQPSKDIIDKIIQETIQISAMFLVHLSPFSKSMPDSGFVYELLVKPTSTDEIFRRIFTNSGFEIEEFLNMDFDPEINEELLDPSWIIEKLEDEESLAPLDETFITTTFLLGTFLDKYFFTLFGYYLKLIQPLYTIPFEYEKSLEVFVSLKNDDITPALFSPCSVFSLTSLGMKYFNVEIAKGDNYRINSQVPGHILTDVILSRLGEKKLSKEAIEEISNYYQGRNKAIYEIKAMLDNNKSFWKYIEVPSQITLHELHCFISEEFDLSMDSDYVFYRDESMNRFTKYSPYAIRGKHTKTYEVTLESLSLPLKHRLVYIYHNKDDKNVLVPSLETKLILEISQAKKPTGVEYYPRVSRISKAYKDQI